MKPYLVVLPALNEERALGSVLVRLKQVSSELDVVVVDDGSKDRTAQVAQELGAQVVRHPCNLGYGASLRTGFRFAVSKGYDGVITMDADGQHDPVSVSTLIRTQGATGADVVIGSRFLEGHYRMPLARRIGSLLFAAVARLYTGYRFTDPTSGFQFLGSQAFSFLADEKSYPADYPDVNVIMLLHKWGFEVVEAPVRMVSDGSHQSMHRGLRPIVYVVKMLLAIAVILLGTDD